MNRFKIEFPFRRSKKAKDPTEATRAIAERLYRNRQVMKRSGSAEEDWAKAERIFRSPIRTLLLCLNQPLIQAEKKAVEPTARWLERADLFLIIDRLSPTLEALGVIAIPLVLFFAAQGYEESLRQQELERIQQQAVTDYLNQLSAILLGLNGSLGAPQNAELRTLTEATTLTLLRDPNLDGIRKGQVIGFLSRMGLVQREVVYGPQRPPLIDLSGAELFGADLSGASLSGADLFNADLRNANLSGAGLFGADLRVANLSDADLSVANLRDADLRDADLSGADLFNAGLGNANLSGADLSGADLSITNLSGADLFGTDLRNANLSGAYLFNAGLGNANLSGADLSDANLGNARLFGTDLRNTDLFNTNLSDVDLRNTRNLTQAQLEDTYLCRTQLPIGVNLNPNRDCDAEWVPLGRR